MATPFKRICRQAIQHASQHRRQTTRGHSAIDTAPCRSTTPSWTTSPPLSRYYNQSSRLSADQREHATNELVEDPFDLPEESLQDLPRESELSSTGYAELEQHRELREMVRVAAWEMPLLTSLSKPFEPPNPRELPLRWRYTTYFGDSHPGSRKVVVEFNVHNLADMTEKQVEKLKKLAGARYNPETHIIRMNCEKFETQAQNKRYLGDVIGTLLAEAKDPNADSYEDVPLDTRHHKFKKQLKFPEEWKMTPERRTQLEDKRNTMLLEEGKRVEDGQVVSGLAAIDAARQAELERNRELVMAEVGQPSARGRQGRREVGPTRSARK